VLVCSQNIVLGNEFYFTNKVFGLLGNITLVLSNGRTLAWTAKIGKNGGAKSDIVGYGYLSDVANITVPVNLISFISTGFVNYTIGDTVNVEIYAQHISGGSNPTIATAVPLIQGVYNALSNTNVVAPPSGPISRTSTTAGPLLVSPANTYTIQNQTGVATDLYVYPASTLTRTLSQSIAIGGTSTSVTGNQYIDLVEASGPPPLPTSPITILTATSEVPIAIDPTVTYEYINNSGGDLNLQIYKDGFPPETLANPFANGASISAPTAGYNGYTATTISPPPPPFPSSPILVTGPVAIPIGIDPTVQYTFENGGSSTMTVTLYVDAMPPGPTLAPTGIGSSVVAPSAGFNGYTVAFA
jgi:hypothetical protein